MIRSCFAIPCVVKISRASVAFSNLLVSSARARSNAREYVFQLGWLNSSRIAWQSARSIGLSFWPTTQKSGGIGEQSIPIPNVESEEKASGQIPRPIQHHKRNLIHRTLRRKLSHKLRELDNPLVISAHDVGHLEEVLSVGFPVDGGVRSSRVEEKSATLVCELEGLFDCNSLFSIGIESVRCEFFVALQSKITQPMKWVTKSSDVNIQPLISFRKKRERGAGSIHSTAPRSLTLTITLHGGGNSNVSLSERVHELFFIEHRIVTNAEGKWFEIVHFVQF